MEKISAVYKITNTVTGDFYIGSSKDVKSRWAAHKCPSVWNNHLNNPMYQDMNRYGVDKFELQILAEIEIRQLKEAEQQFIEKLQPTYNNYNAKGWDIERHKESKKKYEKSERHKESHRKANRKYYKSDKYKEYQQQYQKEYENQLCYYNNETITLSALRLRFGKAGISHPTIEAKKYLIQE